MASHILVTGFEPFGGDSVNPSQELAKAVDGRAIGALVVRSLVLPVQHEAARDIVAAELDADGLAAVVHLGLAGGRARVSLERVAVNVMDYQQPDAAGHVKRDEACAPAGPPAYWSTLPLRALLAGLAAEGIPAHLSYTAGAYLCNFAMYTTLHALAERGRPIPAGFVHLPYLPSMVAAHGQEEPSMDLAVTTRALDVILRTITTHKP
jgi:pyroglutamyl-peptidase